MTSVLLTCLHPLNDKRAAYGRALLKLAADTQPLDQRLVTRLVGTGEKLEQLSTLRHELEQPTPRMVVIQVGLEVLGQIVDAFRKHCHLHLRRPGVAGLGRKGLDDFRLTCGRNRHRVVPFLSTMLSGAAWPGCRPARSPYDDARTVRSAHGRDIGRFSPGQARSL